MHFEHPYLLLLLIVLVPLGALLFTPKKRPSQVFAPEVLALLLRKSHSLPQWIRHTFLLIALAAFIVALARPVIDRGEIKVKTSTIDIIAGFDISRSMFANDIYPNRLELAKRKFDAFLHAVKETRIGVIGFSSRAFMISPLTEDFSTLRYLVSNMNTDMVSLRGTDVMQALEQTDALLGQSRKKALLLFTDGGDKKDFSDEIDYAKSHGIAVFVYNIGTEKGGVIQTERGVMTDKRGDIVVVRRNDAIKKLALETGGAFMVYSLKKNDIKALADVIKARFSEHRENSDVIRDVEELFIYPLSAGIAALLIALYALPRRRNHA